MRSSERCVVHVCVCAFNSSSTFLYTQRMHNLALLVVEVLLTADGVNPLGLHELLYQTQARGESVCKLCCIQDTHDN